MFQRSKNFSVSVQEYMNKIHGTSTHDFLHPNPNPEIKFLKEGVLFLQEYTRTENGPITIIADYDADGIMAGSIMQLGLKRAGIKAQVRIPKRFSEGYGLSEKIIEEIQSGLIITVDNGIAAVSAIAKAKEKGLKVIVTDHHLPVQKKNKILLPAADVVIDPWAYDDSEYKSYCGAGLAYRFIRELLPNTNIDDLKVLAAIATVADIVDINGANWLLLKEGLELINRGRSVPGLKQIMRWLSIDYYVESDFGFRIGPTLNAASRMKDDGADAAFDVITGDIYDFTLPWKAKNLLMINQKRKEVTKEYLNAIPEQKDLPIVLYNPEWMPGLIGIIAGNLCEEYKCPVIALTKKANGTLTGSARSIKGYHMKKILEKCSEYLVSFGGHEQAAGLSLKEEDFPAFKKRFKEVCGFVYKKQKLTYDLEFNSFTDQMIESLQQFAPYGEGHPAPIFHMVYQFQKPSFIGDGSILADKTEEMDFVGFDMTQKYLLLGKPEKVELLGTISLKYYNGKAKPQFEILDMEVIK